MTEPPTKRARRTDSSAMWDSNDKRQRLSHTPEVDSDHGRHSRHGSSRPEDTRRGAKEDRRYRSRSRTRYPRKRDRSVSRDRDRDPKREPHKDGRGMRDRDRSSSRDRHYNRRGYNSKVERSERSRSPRNGTRSRDHPARDSNTNYRDGKRDGKIRNDHRHTNGTSKGNTYEEEDIMSDIEESDDIEAMMRKAVGFTKFRSTKDTKVPGNNIYGVRKEKKTEYRQYMNRVGGFNRPLSP